MSPDMQRMYEIAREMDKSYTADMFHDSVRIHHEDGTDYFFDNAFAMIYFDKEHGDGGACLRPGEYLFVFAEHHGIHVFSLDEISRFHQYKEMPIPNHPDHPGRNYICETCSSQHVELRVKCPDCDTENAIRAFTPEELEENEKFEVENLERISNQVEKQLFGI